jgi:hypothetical protein
MDQCVYTISLTDNLADSRKFGNITRALDGCLLTSVEAMCLGPLQVVLSCETNAS